MNNAMELFLKKYNASLGNGGVESVVVISLTIVFISAIVFLVARVLLLCYRKLRKKRIQEKSQRYIRMRELCDRYHFESVSTGHSFFQCKSKAEFDRFVFQSYLEEVVEYQFSALKEKIDSAERNKLKLIAFQQDFVELPGTAYKTKGWIAEEADLVNALQPKPSCVFKLEIDVVYISPKGRNSYEKKKIYKSSEILSAWERVQKRRTEENTRQAQIKRERSKVTSGLRYEVMRRDGYRCKICGSSQSDGVKLHVDHIVPVSKGGKTTMSNLQTLCDRCNLGKSDKL